MENIFHIFDGFFEQGIVIQIAFDKFKIAADLFQIFTKTGWKVVENFNFCPLPEKFVGKIRADKTGSSGY